MSEMEELLARLERVESVTNQILKVVRSLEKGNELDRWLQLDQAAAYLGVSKRTLSRYAHARKISYAKGDGATSPLRFKISVLEAFAQKNSVPARRRLS